MIRTRKGLIAPVLFLFTLGLYTPSGALPLDCNGALSISLGENFDRHITQATLKSYDPRPLVASGGHTVSALQNFARLRPDIFPSGIFPFGHQT